jgi:hypothetical protein
MRTSGQSNEGRMSLIPLGVLLFLVMVGLGGPESFMDAVATFAADVIAYTASWVRDL